MSRRTAGETTLLRLVPDEPMVSAAVFEAALGGLRLERAGVRRVSAAWFMGRLLEADGPATAEERLGELTAEVDVLFPSYEVHRAIPLLLALRNRIGLSWRLLWRAHSPAATPLEWALAAPLLRRGDTILCPSRSAAALLQALAPGLEPYLALWHPPVALPSGDNDTRLSSSEERRGRSFRVVALGRVDKAKLLHRLVDALTLTEELVSHRLTLEIGGPLGARLPAGRTNEETAYARALRARLSRLGLEDRVKLVGELGDSARRDFLRGGKALVNLSASLEESFGMAPVEALGVGTPVLASRWDGLPEAVGAGGRLVPVEAPLGGAANDVDPEVVARQLTLLLQEPPDRAVCLQEAEKAAPSRQERELSAIISRSAESFSVDDGAVPEELADRSAAPAGGLLARSLPLAALGYGEVFAAFAGEVSRRGQSAANLGTVGAGRLSSGDWGRLRPAIDASLLTPLSRLLAGLPPAPGDAAGGPPAEALARTLLDDRDLDSASSPGRIARRAGGEPYTASSSIAVLTALAGAGGIELGPLLGEGVRRLRARVEGRTGVEVAAMTVAFQAGEHQAALAIARRLLDLVAAAGSEQAWRLESYAGTLVAAARTMRLAGAPAGGIEALEGWLARCPDGAGALEAWWELAASSIEAGGAHLGGAATAIETLRRFTSDDLLLGRLRGALVAAAVPRGG